MHPSIRSLGENASQRRQLSVKPDLLESIRLPVDLGPASDRAAVYARACDIDTMIQL